MKKILFLFLLAAVSLQNWADEYYLVGGCTDSGWNAGESTRSAVRAYTSDGTNWAWAGYISAASDADAGRFKIPNSTDGWNGFWASAQNTVITSEGVDLSTDGTDDRKFRLAETGYYLITFNTSTKKIYAEKLTAPSQNGGYYLINSVSDYYYFAAYIATDGTRNSKAKLKADLDFSGKTFIPLASEKYPFTGEFDGQCHTIKNAKVAVEYSRIGLFACVSSNANIHDLIIDNNCSFSGWAKVAGIAGHALGGGDSVGTVTLSNIINNANITSTGGQNGNEGHTAGFIACCNGNVNLSATNCANTGDIDGQRGECAAFVGWNGTAGTSFTNCWNIGEIADEDTEVFEETKHKRLYRGSGSITPSRCYDLGHNDQGSSFSNDDLESGKLCYLLNNAQGGTNWYQTLSGTTDATPIPFNSHKKVYKFGSEDSYLNDGDTKLIGTAADLDNFSTVVNAGATSLNAEVTANITANAAFTPIGTSTYMYKGTFDGNGKSIELSINNTSSSVNNRALIGYATGGATIQNLILTGSVESSGGVTAGFIAEVNGSGEVTITNCGNEAEIRGNGSSGEVAAIIANNYGANGACALKLTNVYNVGDVYGATGTTPSTICGSQNHDDTAFKNVYNYGHVYLNGALSNRYAQFARGALYNGNSVGSYDNCYSTILNETDIQNTQDGDSPDIKKIEDSDVSSGELTCLLNGSTNGGTNFYQSLGTDNYPVLDSSHGKVWKSLCAEHDDEIQYSNSAIGQSTSHVFEEPNTTGHCTQCQQYYVSTGAQMKGIADGISGGTIDNDIHIYFTQDIDFAGVTGYAGIGTDTDGKRFCGILDGQDHSVNNMTIDSSNSGVGLIGTVSDGAVIQKVIVTSSCTVKGSQYVAGIVGSTNGTGTGIIKITRCGNEAAIQATNGSNSNAAGILGCRRGSNRIEISNCYNAGTIKGPVECAGISAWMGTNFSLNKCYNIGSIDSKVVNDQYLVRVDNNTGNWNDASSITDCYQINNNNNITVNDTTYTKSSTNYTIKVISSDEITSGELCYKLNGEEDAGTDWYQTLGTDNYPVPFDTHEKIYYVEVDKCDDSDTGEHTYNNSSDNVVLPHEYEEGWCSICNEYQENAISPADGWYEISEPWQLRWMAESVNEHNSTYKNANIKLTANIDYSAYTNQAAMIGKEGKTYKGTFDGQFHTVTVAFNNTSADETGLVQRMNGGTIKNLRVDGTISTDKKLAAGICSGIWQTGTITNCWSNVTITDGGTGDATHGGIVAHVKNNTNVNITHCLFSGEINAPNRTGSGALVGWADSEDDNIKINHCLVVGEVNLKSGEDNDIVCRRNATTSDNYYTCDISKVNNNRGAINACSYVAGELCYLLNESTCYDVNWTQTLGTDTYPVPFNTHGIVNKMSAAGYTTQYIPTTDVTIPTGVEAYTGVILSEGWLHLNAIENGKIAAGEAVILKGNEGYYSFVPTTDAEEVEGNVLKGSDGTITGGDGIYALAKKGNPAVVGFYSVDSDVPVPAGKVYLDSDGSLVKVFKFAFDDDDATGINSPLLTSPEEEGQVYNLAGQRVSKLQRGINIINGKKVLK